MNRPGKNVDEIRSNLLDPAFEMIKDCLISRGHEDPEIVCEKDAVELSFNDKQREIYKYRCWISENGRIYGEAHSPGETLSNYPNRDSSKTTPRMILDLFINFFRFVI